MPAFEPADWDLPCGKEDVAVAVGGRVDAELEEGFEGGGNAYRGCDLEGHGRLLRNCVRSRYNRF